MQKILFIILLLLSCEDLLESIKEGCTTATACNYDAEATLDNESCVSPQGYNDWRAGDPLSVQN